MSMRYSVFGGSWRNLRYAGRRLIQTPGFTVTAVVSLALGIGANTAIFSLVNAILLRHLPFRTPEELVDVYESNPDLPYTPFSYPDYADFRDGTREVFSEVLASRIVLLQVESRSSVEVAAGEAVTGNYFPGLGVRAHLGRTLLPQDDIARGAHPVVMLGYGHWQRAFGGDPGVVGREIRLGGRPYTIVGVAPHRESPPEHALHHDHLRQLRGRGAAAGKGVSQRGRQRDRSGIFRCRRHADPLGPQLQRA
jgi:hypothetical protein